MEQELGERMRAWRRAHPKATMYEIEEELDAQIAVMRAQLLAETAVAGASGAESAAEAAAVCPVCQGKMVKEGKRKRKLKTTGDQEVVLERVYMRCPQCGYGVFPPG
jgi:YgiT-type zinc finger domain-containing protein